ncbi:MAG: hypothetical protein WDZ70_00405 [Candidatus Paceibacterota bacterium]
MNDFLKKRSVGVSVLGLTVILFVLGKIFSLERLYELGLPLRIGSFYLLIIAFVLLILPSAGHIWKKFALWAVPVTILFIVATPGFIGGGLLGGVDYVEVTKFWGKIFLIISLIVIGASALRKKLKS